MSEDNSKKLVMGAIARVFHKEFSKQSVRNELLNWTPEILNYFYDFEALIQAIYNHLGPSEYMELGYDFYFNKIPDYERLYDLLISEGLWVNDDHEPEDVHHHLSIEIKRAIRNALTLLWPDIIKRRLELERLAPPDKYARFEQLRDAVVALDSLGFRFSTSTGDGCGYNFVEAVLLSPLHHPHYKSHDEIKALVDGFSTISPSEYFTEHVCDMLQPMSGSWAGFETQTPLDSKSKEVLRAALVATGCSEELLRLPSEIGIQKIPEALHTTPDPSCKMLLPEGELTTWWEVSLSGLEVKTSWGDTETPSHSETTEFADHDAAVKFVIDQTIFKLGCGYVDAEIRGPDFRHYF